jgi:uncharacterized protein (DUF983 family)
MTIEMSSTPFIVLPVEELPAKRDRNIWRSIKLGLAGKCPNCGKGKIFYRYLKVNDCCPACGEELFHHRADDAPPYLTILVVGHIIGAGMLGVESFAPDLPLVYHMTIWPALTLGLCLILLPMFKGALIALQWALRMHGFEMAGTRIGQDVGQELR